MKTYIHRLLMITLTVGLAFSCKDVLEEEVPDYLVLEENVFKDPAQVLLAVNGMYDPISWGQNSYTSGGFSHSYEFIFGDICSDNALKGSEQPDQEGIQQLKTFTATSGNQNIIAYWNKHWAAIARANLVLKNLPTASVSEENRKIYEGEAKFIRAYAYFSLIKVFGGQPTFVSPVTGDQINARSFKRDPLYVNYKLIENDLRDASTLLPVKGTGRAAGRATSGAAAAYLARAIMYQIGTDNTNEHTWSEVLTLTEDLITGEYGVYELAPNYAEIFEFEGENNIESIFEIQAVDNGEDAGKLSTGSMWTVLQNPASFGGWGFNVPTLDLVNAYEANDPRRPSTVISVGEHAYGQELIASIRNQTNYYHRKAIAQPELWTGGSGKTEKGSFQNIRKFRLADVILMNAEAAYHTGDEAIAKARLVAIRNRASASTYPKGWDSADADAYPATGFTPLDNTGIQSATGEALLDSIKLERRRELGMEATRLWDLVRWGEYQSAITNTYADEFDNANTSFAATVAQDMLAHALTTTVKEAADQVIVNPIPLFPIPGFDAVGWGITQNPGY